MKLQNKAFPYPVLRPETADYTDSAFQAIIEPLIVEEGGQQSVKISYNFMLANQDILNLIESDLASFAVELNCKDTLFRKIIQLNDGGELEFEDNELYGRVEITPFIIATSLINDFSPTDLNPEFGGQAFSFVPGDIVAYDEQQMAYIEFGKLKFESMILVETSQDVEPFSYSFSLDSEIITILMGEELRAIWEEVRHNRSTRPFLAMSVYKDCIYAALDYLCRMDNADEHKWARAFKVKLHGLGVTLPENAEFEDLNKIAQELVKNIGVKRILLDG